MRMSPLYMLSVMSLTFACGRGPAPSTQKERWDAENDPGLMDSMVAEHKYIREFSQLPLKASLDVTPWSDHYWPTYTGGITYRWNVDGEDDESRYAYDLVPFDQLQNSQIPIMSPSEKYDLFLGREDYPFTRWERSRTDVLKTVRDHEEFEGGFSIPRWEGLCHAWAPAALLFEEPNPVVMTGKTGHEIAFGASDVKAMLIYFLHETKADTNFLGTRCNVDLKELTKKYNNREISYRYYQEQLKACSNVNAGAFHLVLTNQIGRLKEGFIADVDKGPEVWNHPVYAFQIQIVGEKPRATKGAAPGTVKEIEVVTDMSYVVEIGQGWERLDQYDATKTKKYHYRLEIDKDGKVVGGAWIGNDHPDFLWKQAKPEFRGIYKGVQEIYEASLKKKENQTETVAAE